MPEELQLMIDEALLDTKLVDGEEKEFSHPLNRLHKVNKELAKSAAFADFMDSRGTNADIAARYGISVNTVRYWIYQAAVPWYEEKEEVRQAYEKNITEEQVEDFGKTISLLSAWVRDSAYKMIKDGKVLSPVEQTRILKAITDLNKLVALRKGEPTEISKNIKSLSMEEVIDMAKKAEEALYEEVDPEIH